MAELTSVKLPIDKLTDSEGRSFFLRADGIIHNGVNIESTEAINCIADGKIIAMRLTDDYENINSIKEDEPITESFLASYHLNRFYNSDNLIDDPKVEKSKNDKTKYYYTKETIETKNGNRIERHYQYYLKKDLKPYDKIEALYFLNEIISNNFILIEHDLVKINGNNIKFYSLYNHLAPLGRMTNEQKLNLPWYEHKIKINSTQKIAVYNLKNGDNIKSRTLKENVESTTEFDFNYDDIKKYNTKNPQMPIKIKYLNNKKESNEGYIYLNENKKYDEKTWNDAINKFWNVINEKKDSIDFLNFKINVKLKDKIQKNTISYPNNFEVKTTDKVGYSGFNFMEEDKLADNTVILKDGKSRLFTVHVETFFENDSELKFNYNNEEWDPFYFNVNSNYNACIEKPTTEGTKATETYTRSLIEKLGEEKFYSDEVYYKIKVIANVKENSFYVINGAFTNWNKELGVYIPNGKSPVTLYDSSGIKLENKTIFDSQFYYLYGSESGNFRKFKYFYEIVNKVFYIKQEDFNKLSKDIKYQTAADIYTLAKEGKHFFIHDKLNSSNLFTEIHKKEVSKELINATIENPVKLEFKNKKIYEYVHASTLNIKDSWYKTKSNNKEYWIKLSDIKSEKNGTSVEVVSYNDWKKGFELLQLNDKSIFKIKDYENLIAFSSDIEKVQKQREKNIRNLKKALESKNNSVDEKIINTLVSNTKSQRNYIFEHKNEWDNNKNLVNAYKDNTKLKKQKFENTLKIYAFMDSVKTKLNNKDTFFYVNPYYFVHRLDKILSIPDFNPYIIDGQPVHHKPRIKGDDAPKNVNDPEYFFKTNIGFATGSTEIDNEKFITSIHHTINDTEYYFPKLNCPCGYSYAYWDVTNSDGTHKPHTGIDLTGKLEFWKNGKISKTIDNLPIFSFINGEVWAIKEQSAYGHMLFIKHKNSSMLYLLAHLKKDGIKVQEGENVKPGQIVALAGNSGTGGNTTHLHLEVFDVGDFIKEKILDEDHNLKWIITPTSIRRDPLDNTVKYNDLLKKSKKRLGLE